MTVTHKINKLEKLGGPQDNFHALFGRSAAVYGHFRADAVTSEWSTCISPSNSSIRSIKNELKEKWTTDLTNVNLFIELVERKTEKLNPLN